MRLLGTLYGAGIVAVWLWYVVRLTTDREMRTWLSGKWNVLTGRPMNLASHLAFGCFAGFLWPYVGLTILAERRQR